MLADSLNLELLNKRLKIEKREARWRWITFFVVIALLTIGYFALTTSPSPKSKKECDFACSLSLFIAICPPVLIVGIPFIAYFNWWRRNSTAKLYLNRLPALDLPPVRSPYLSKGIILTIIWEIIWAILTIGLRIAINLDFGLMILPLLLPVFIPVAAAVWVQSAVNQGNYDEAIRRAQSYGRWYQADSGPSSLEVMGHFFAGHTQESEYANRLLVAQMIKRKVYAALGLNNYACELTLQARYDEALPFLETAINSQPHYANTYDSLAAWYLAQNRNAARALEVAQFGLNLSPPSWLRSKSGSYAVRLANRAWAEACNGLADRARATLAEAFKKANPKVVPYFAELNRIAGETYITLNDLPAARQHFARAAETDPNGRIGKLAREKLNSLPAAD